MQAKKAHKIQKNSAQMLRGRWINAQGIDSNARMAYNR